jgi:hypothetical protein
MWKLSLINYPFSVKIIAFPCKTVLYIINRNIHGCLEIPDLFLVLYNKQKYTWMLGNTRSISRVEHDISLVCCAYTLEISCSTLEINLVLPRTHVLFSTIMIIIFKLLKCHSIYSIIVYDHFSGWWRSSRRTWITGT